MAYDKLVDSSALDAGLRQIANAIREKGGTSDNLAFPAAMAEAIAAIQAGGGVKIASGSFTVAEDLTIASDSTPWIPGYTIQHGLGVYPSYYLLFSSVSGTGATAYEFLSGFAYPKDNDKTSRARVFAATGGGSSNGIVGMIGINSANNVPSNLGFTEDTVPYMRHGYNKQTKYLASRTYYWVVIAEETA